MFKKGLPAPGLRRNARLNKVKKSSKDSPRGSDVHLQWGPFVKGPAINYVKRKDKFKQSKNVLLK